MEKLYTSIKKTGYHTIILILLTIFSFFCEKDSYAQHQGSHFIKNYKTTEIEQLAPPNCIVQDKNGLILLGSKKGITIFDGQRWKLLELPHQSPVYSLYKDARGQIFVGGENEFGYLEINAKGSFVYSSLTQKLPASNKFSGTIIEITGISSKVIFASSNHLICYEQGKCKEIKIDMPIERLFNFAGRVFAVQKKNNICEYINERLQKLPMTGLPENSELIDLIKLNDQKTLAIENTKGIYELNQNHFTAVKTVYSDIIAQRKANCVLKLNTKFAIGLKSNGLLLINKDGSYEHFNKSKMLIGDQIHCLLEDQCGNLWIGHELGITYLELNSPFLYYDLPEQAPVNAAILHNNQLYLGTSIGALCRAWPLEQESSAKIIAGIENEDILGFKTINHQLYAFADKGIWMINETKASKQSNEHGILSLLELKHQENLVLAGTKRGISLYRKSKESLELVGETKGLPFVPKEIGEDAKGEIWVCNSDQGLYCAKLDTKHNELKSIRQYGKRKGLPSDLGNHLYSYNDRLRITSEKGGIYNLHEKQDVFVLDRDFDNQLGLYPRIWNMHEDQNKNIWFFDQNGAHVLLKPSDSWYQLYSQPLGGLRFKMNKHNEFVLPIDQRTLFATINGFAIFDSLYAKDYRFHYKAMIRKVQIIGEKDSTAFDGETVYEDFKHAFPKLKNKFTFSSQVQTFRFECASPFFENEDKLKYSFFLEGYDKQWSDWDEGSRREYTHLPKGKYIFHVVARNSFGVESHEDSFVFNISTPWHQSMTAYFVYFMIFVFIGLKLINTYSHKIRAKSQAVSLIQKKEIYYLNKQLEVLVKEQKKRELNVLTRFLIKKNELLIHLKTRIEDLMIKSNQEMKAELPELVRNIDESADTDEDWVCMEDGFELLFDSFLKKLKTSFPELAYSELKLCAFIKMEIGNKEIASLMNTSLRGVDGYRYRIRKKLNLNREDNLNEFLSNFGKKEDKDNVI